MRWQNKSWKIKALSQPKKIFHFNSSSIFSRKKQEPSHQISLESQRSESYPRYEKRAKSKRNLLPAHVSKTTRNLEFDLKVALGTSSKHVYTQYSNEG